MQELLKLCSDCTTTTWGTLVLDDNHWIEETLLGSAAGGGDTAWCIVVILEYLLVV